MEAPSELLPAAPQASSSKQKPVSMAMFLAGQWVNTSEQINVRNPYSNEIIGSVPCANRKHIKVALEKTRKRSVVSYL